jgi:flagellar P-ring protein FlgI
MIFAAFLCANAGSLAQETKPAPAAEVKPAAESRTAVRIKELATIEGVRDNQLLGYGLVIGLNKTGDRVQQTLYSRQTLQNLLERMGLTARPDGLQPDNIATVLVTATLPPFIRQGSRIDVLVSSVGNASSLAGGTLILTSLKGVDGQIYALAQGPLSVGGLSAGAGGNSVQVNHPTVARVPNGAIVERSVQTTVADANVISLVLRETDFTTASRVQKVINGAFGEGAARATDGRTIAVMIPAPYENDHVGFIAQLEALTLETDALAKIVINERTGTIVMGRNVRVSAVSITQGGVVIRIGTDFDVSQPNPLAGGQTTVVPQTTVAVQQKPAQSVSLPDGATVEEVVRGLRMVGVSTGNIISILQAMKGAGALNAEIEMQ